MQVFTTERKWKNMETFPKNIGKLSHEELLKLKDKNWYVRFRYWDERKGKWKLFIKTGGVNYPGPLRERIKQLHALKVALTHALDVDGWNPITGEMEQDGRANGAPVMMASVNEMAKMSFSEAIDFAYQQKENDLAKKTRAHYKTAIKFFKAAATTIAVNRSGLLMRDEVITALQKAHYKILLDQVQRTRKLDAKGFNKYRSTLSALVRELTELVLERNAVGEVSKKVVVDKVSMKHRAPDAKARKTIIDKIRNDHFAYYRFLAVLYGCTLRPKEICALKIKEIDWEKQEFFIQFDVLRENLKVRKERSVAIPDWVLELLKGMKLCEFNPEWFIFSCNGKRGGAFVPGEKMMHPNTTCDYWKKIVHVGLGIKVSQYSLKKLSGNDMIKMQCREGINRLLDVPREHMGHTSNKTTSVYVDEHLEVIKEYLKRKMPVL